MAEIIDLESVRAARKSEATMKEMQEELAVALLFIGYGERLLSEHPDNVLLDAALDAADEKMASLISDG